MALSFEWLIDPVLPAAFFETYFEREPLLITRRQPARYASLLSLDAIDHYLATASPTSPDVFLVDAARELKLDDYSFPNSDPPGRLDLPRVYELFGSGATISLSQLHERQPQLAALCRAVEKRFSAHFQTNIYLSPPNAQGFQTHFDSHDVFVLQVAGSKLWTLYDTPVELPLRGQAFEPERHVAGQVTREFTIRAGDLFYCPRGLLHAARSTDEVSLHVTLGLIGKTWADVMVEAVSEACLGSPEFREHLPVGYAEPGFDKARAETKFRLLLDAFTRKADLAPILDRLAEDFVRSRKPDSYGRLQELHDAKPITRDSKVEPRPHLIYRLREEGEKIALLFGSSTIALPAFAGEPLAFALKGPPFVVRDMPGRLDEAGKVVLVRRMIKEGLLRRCDDSLPQFKAPASDPVLAK
jgi:hypothetical protein